jgi:CRP-like cAMP-binding protein
VKYQSHRDKFFVLESGVCDMYASYSPKANEYSAPRESLDVKPPSSTFGRGTRGARDSRDVIHEQGGGEDPYMNVMTTPGLREKLGKRLPKRFEAGTSFGEVALLYSSARTASVVTATACTLWVLHRSHYSTIKRRFALTVRTLRVSGPCSGGQNSGR